MFTSTFVSAETTPFISFEREYDTQITNRLILGLDLKLPNSFRAEIQYEATDDLTGKFTFDEIEIKLDKRISNDVKLYMKNKFDREMEHDETKVGIKISF